MGEQSALIFKVNKGAYQSMSWSQVGRYATELGCGLAELGVEPNDKVAIFSQTSHLWVIADIATICNGAISVPIYPTSALSDIDYILNNSEAKVVFVQDKRLLQKVLSIRESLPHVKAFVLMEPNANKKVIAEIVSQNNLEEGYLLTIEELQRRGAKYVLQDKDLLRRRSDAIKPDNIATIIYTSGTTGVPKGVPLTH
ncbi:MAG: AMP-binding protein, partial [Cyanobacteria bacterium]|nr:AMP-binding protein [Cyanobacteriota bacterium]